MRDYALGATIYIQFTTRAFATGVPTILAGSPVLSVREQANATPITAGVSVTIDACSVTGLNEAVIVATGGNGFETGKDYGVYISTGTVGGTSVVGEVVGTFSIEKSPVNWANVTNPTTTLGLTGTTVKTATDVETDTADIQSRIPAALVSGRIDASVGAIAANAITAAAIATDAIDSDAIAASAVTEIQTGLSTLDAAGVRSAVGLAAANLDTQIGDLPTAAENASAALTTAMSEAYRANGGTATLAQAIYEILGHLGEAAISGTTKTVNKIDHGTVAATYTLDDAITPTSITRAT